MNMLWVSLRVPYDGVGHAGGKIHNYYIKEFQKQRDVHIHLISICMQSEIDKLDLKYYGIEASLIYYGESFFCKTYRKLINLPREMNPFHPNGFITKHRESCIMKKIYEYSLKKKEPNIIILQWTEIVLLMPQIRKIFPNAKYVCIEEDVAYLGLKRKADYCDNKIKKCVLKNKYINLKKSELSALKSSDLIVVNNFKDKNLLISEGIDNKRVFTACPYFDSYENIKRENFEKNILFYGAMNRIENEESVIWFIKNVFNKLENYKLIIVGNQPTERLKQYASDKIIITGFVQDVTPFFIQAFCLVAPLVLGAGIKIKILEAMSAGVPVLTNNIGIEGIGAVPNRDYIHCTSANDYIDGIKKLSNLNRNDEIGQNGKKFVRLNFNKEVKMNEFIDRVNLLLT